MECLRVLSVPSPVTYQDMRGRIYDMPAHLLPRCKTRGCWFRFRQVGDGTVFEHHDSSGQSRGLRITNAEVNNVDLDIWAEIAPFYEALHDGEAPA